MYNNGTLINQGDAGINPISNLTTFAMDGIYNITCEYEQDSGTNYSNSWTWYYVNVTTAVDNNNPYFYNFGVNPVINTPYSSGALYNFTLNILATNGTAGIEFDGVNYSLTNNSNYFEKAFEDLPAGTYSYYYWAYGNGTDKNYNVTELFSYTIDKAVPPLSLIAKPDWSIVNGTESNVSGEGCPSQLSCELFREGSLVSNPDVQTLAIGQFIYIFNSTGNMNYTTYSTTNTLIVNSTTPSPTVVVSGGGCLVNPYGYYNPYLPLINNILYCS
jgi:hypothetical protein